MNYLSVERITKTYGIRTLFEDLTFGISKGQKVALVAKNGTGKTTLLKILTDEETADDGAVVYRKDLRVGFLAQHHGLDENLSILENLFSADSPMMRAVQGYEKALLNPEDEQALQYAYDAMDRTGAWEYESRAKQILGSLQITDLDQPTEKLSGGQMRRVALAKVLIDEPDFLILDEPTNHLDLDMIEWLEQFLVKTQMTLLMVTHDRYFLEVVCDEILELENQQLYRYKGNFSYYLEKKSEREELDASSQLKAQNTMRRELKWIRTQPKARGTKSKYRKEQFGDLKARAKKIYDDDQVQLEINMSRLGSKIVELHKLKMAFGEKKILEQFDYVFKGGEKVGIVGANGSGKTTFLKLLTKELEPTGGKIVVGDTVVFGHFSQSGIVIEPGKKVIEVVREIADVIPLAKGRKITAEQMLERFLFPRKQQHDFVEKLSGGERKRLQLLTVLMSNPNFLILDEPTNDLDIFTLSVLEEYLTQYPGCLIVVSHDRYFMDKVVDHIFYFKGEGEIKDIIGNYTEYRAELATMNQVATAAAVPKKEKIKAEKADTPKTKLSFKEKFEFDQLEDQIANLEEAKAELETALNTGDLDHETLAVQSAKLGEIMSELEIKENRWLELSEYV